MAWTTGNSSRRSGFTLLELILVMALLAIVVALAVPSLHGFARGRRAGDCAENLVSLTRWARTHAIARGLTYRLNVDPGAGKFWLTMVQDDGTVAMLGDDFGQTFQAPEGVTLSWNAPQQQDGQYIQFLPNGRTDPAVIQIVDQSGKMIQVACWSATETYHVVGPDEPQPG